jgi:hypothetical protein
MGSPAFNNFVDRLKTSNYKGMEIEKLIIEKWGMSVPINTPLEGDYNLFSIILMLRLIHRC